MTRFTPALAVLLLPLALCGEEPKVEMFSSKDGKFSVTLPEKPKEKTTKLKVGMGKDAVEVELHVFTVNQKDRAFVITYNDYPKAVVGEDRDKFLAGVVERNAAYFKGKVASNEKIAVGKGKHPGRAVVIELPDQKRTYRAKIVLVGDRLYQVVAMGPAESAKGKEVEDYLKSFAVDE